MTKTTKKKSDVRKSSKNRITTKQTGGDEEKKTSRQTNVREKMLKRFESFIEYHPARRFSQNLRSLFLEFLMYDGSTEAEYLRDLAIDLTGLFDLLDAIELVQGTMWDDDHE